MATYNQCITDDDDKFLDASYFFGSSSGTLSLNTDVFGATNAVADGVGRGGIAWNPEVTAVGQQGSLSKIPLASHDGFHDCKQFFYNGFDMYTEEGADSLNLEDIALDGAQDGSISLFAEPDDHENFMDAIPDGDMGGSATLGGSAAMSSIIDRVSSMFPKTDNADDLRNELQKSAGLSPNQQNHTALLDAIVHENETVIRAADGLNASDGKSMSATKAAR